jgi:HMG box factor
MEEPSWRPRYPGYRYQPVYRRTNVIRRRVRKDEAEDEKCQSVAELLLKGKSGEALESEIKDKIQAGPEVTSRASSRKGWVGCLARTHEVASTLSADGFEIGIETR